MPLSFTQLRTFSSCPKLYYYVYELGLRLPPPFNLIEGRAYHKTVEAGNLELLERRALRAAEFVERYEYELQQALFLPESEEGALVAPEEVQRSIEGARQILPIYTEGVYQSLAPQLVEHRFDVELDNQSFCGVVDLVEHDRIVDYKVVSRTHTQEVVRKSPQLHLYAHYLRRPRVAHIQFGRRTGEVRMVEAVPAPVEIENTLRWAQRTAAAIEACRKSGVWPPCSREAWSCSPEYCGFYGICYRKEVPLCKTPSDSLRQ